MFSILKFLESRIFRKLNSNEILATDWLSSKVTPGHLTGFFIGIDLDLMQSISYQSLHEGLKRKN